MSNVNGVALAVLIALFALVTGMGFWATRWRRPTSMESLDEWGLGGRSFGTWITWFLLGGDLYTAYTFVAVPAAMFAAGSVAGFFAVPYTIVLYPIIFIFMAPDVVGQPPARLRHHRRLRARPLRFSRALARGRGHRASSRRCRTSRSSWSASRPCSRWSGLGGGDSIIAKDLPLFIAFAAAGGLHLLQRAAGAGGDRVRQGHPDLPRHHRGDHLPARQGRRLGRRSSARREAKMAAPNPVDGKPNGVFIPGAAQHWAYATLGLGSALALFMYPHSITATPVGSRRGTRCGATPRSCRPTASCSACWPCSAGSRSRPAPSRSGSTASPTRSSSSRSCSRTSSRRGSPASPSRRSPSARWCRRRSCRSRRRTPSPATSTRSGSSPTPRRSRRPRSPSWPRWSSRLFALVFVLLLDKQNAINFQLLGGIWILQTFPAIVFGLYTRWFHRWALLAGWAVGMVYGTWQAYERRQPARRHDHFGGSLAQIPVIGQLGYIALTAFVINLRRRGRADRGAARWSRRPTATTRRSAATTSPTPATRGCRRCSSRSTRRRPASEVRMPCRRRGAPARHTLAACASR